MFVLELDMFGREFCGAGGVELFFLEWSAAKHPLSTSSFFLEQRRRTVCHFIKVEENHMVRKTTLGA
jgi:hypothetical protein